MAEVINPTTKVKLSIQHLITDQLDLKLKERAQLIILCPSKALTRPEEKKIMQFQTSLNLNQSKRKAM